MPNLRHFFVMTLLAPLFASAAPPPYPLQRPALTINQDNGRSLTLSLEALQKLPSSSIRVRNAEGRIEQWSGVSLLQVLEHAGAQDYRTIHASALNNYSVLIPKEDLQRFQPLVAYLRDGHYMAVRDNGPLQLIYPFDDYPELRKQIYYNRAIWQLSEIRPE